MSFLWTATQIHTKFNFALDFLDREWKACISSTKLNIYYIHTISSFCLLAFSHNCADDVYLIHAEMTTGERVILFKCNFLRPVTVLNVLSIESVSISLIRYANE